MTKKPIFSIFPVLVAFAIGGCASTGSNTTSNSSSTREAAPKAQAQAAQAREEREIVGTPAKNSKFNKVKIGMSQREVEHYIGPGTDVQAYITGKSFIPFYMGADRYRYEVYYKGAGRLVYQGGGINGGQGLLVKIVHNASETGFASKKR